MSNLYKQYLKEEENRDTIETEFGFITYSIYGEECYIAEVYVLPEFRCRQNSLTLKEIVKVEALEAGCRFLTANVFLEDDIEKYTRKVRLMIDSGFLIKRVQEKNIIFWQKIGG
jgi:hypothetical protein